VHWREYTHNSIHVGRTVVISLTLHADRHKTADIRMLAV